MRLVGSSSSLEGRVEVCYEGVWGQVCNSLWSDPDAEIVCRELGHATAGKHHFIITDNKSCDIYSRGSLFSL